MQNKFPLIALLVFLPLFNFAQIKGARGTYVWPKYTPVQIPDSLKSEDAFFIENVTTYDILDGYQTNIVVFKRTYINSEKAAEELSQQELFLGRDGRMAILRARTLKVSGEVIDLDGDQIIETMAEKKNKYGSERVRRIQFVYPKVEVGDVIDMVYEISLDGYIFSDLLYLEDDLPSMHSRISLRNFSLLDLTVYRLNSAPPIESKPEAGGQIINWQANGVKSIKTDYFNALPPDHPTLVFVLWKRGEDLNYGTWYYSHALEFPLDYEVLSSIKKQLIDQGVVQESDDPFTQLRSLIQFCENECSWTDDSNIYLGKTLDYLTNKKVNEVLYVRYIMKFVKELGLRIEKGFSKSLLNGRFEHGFVSLEQLSNDFLIIYDQENQPHYLFPPSGEGLFYYLDEIPFYLEGNQSIALYGERDILKAQGPQLLPESDVKQNTHSAQIKIKLETDSLTTTFERKDKLTGHYSYLTRDDYGDIWLDELGIAPDSLELKPVFSNGNRTEAFYPYQVEFEQSNRTEVLFHPIDDTLGWLNLSALLPLGIYQGDELDAEFGDYVVLPFLKRHTISLFFQCDDGISIAEDERKIITSNEVGSVEMSIYQLSESVIKIQVNVELKARYLKNEDIKSFEELLQSYSEIRQKKWLLKR